MRIPEGGLANFLGGRRVCSFGTKLQFMTSESSHGQAMISRGFDCVIIPLLLVRDIIECSETLDRTQLEHS